MKIQSKFESDFPNFSFSILSKIRILGNNEILNLFTIDKHTGQLFIKDTMALDVNHLNSENIYFSVEVCNVIDFGNGTFETI